MHTLTSKILEELRFADAGEEICAPLHSYGPAVRNYYLFHFIISGKGRFESDQGMFELCAGQGFLICPGQLCYYQADAAEPWHYVWLGFCGVAAAELPGSVGLDKSTPIFTCPDIDRLYGCMSLMGGCRDLYIGRDLARNAVLLGFFALLAEWASPPKGEDAKLIYIKNATEFMSASFHKGVTIDAVARHVGLERSYLSRLFKEYTGFPPQDYLIRLKMDFACQLLKNSDLSITDIARSAGYSDQPSFTKAFRKYAGQSPSSWRL